MSNNSVGGNHTDAGAGTFGGCTQTALANFRTITAFDGWPPELGRYVRAEVANSMAESIVRLEQEAEELRAEVALLQEQARILQAERDEARNKGVAL